MIFWILFESLLTLPLLYAIMSTIIEFRFRKLRCAAIIGLAIICTIVMDSVLLLSGISLANFYSYAWLTTCVPSFLSLLYLARYKDGSLIFAFLSMCVLASITTSLSNIFSYIILSDLMMIRIVIHAAILAVIFIACRMLFREKLYRAARAQGNRWILYCTLPVLCLVIWVMYNSSSSQLLDIKSKVYIPYAGYMYPQNIPTLIVLLVCFFYTLVLILIIIIRTFQADLERCDKLALDYEIKLLHDHLSGLEEKDESMRILRHDMRHHLSTLSGLMEHQEYLKEAREYLRQLDNTLTQTKRKTFCSNAVINATLSSYDQKVQRDGILLFIAVQIPEVPPVNIMDIAAVLSNALENAHNACLRQDAAAQRFITIKFIQNKKQYILDISNSYSGSVTFDLNGHPVSMEENHGIGSQSIDAFVRKYDAIADYSALNGIFRLSIMFTKLDE